MVYGSSGNTTLLEGKYHPNLLESRFEFELFTSERNLLENWNTPTSCTILATRGKELLSAIIITKTVHQYNWRQEIYLRLTIKWNNEFKLNAFTGGDCTNANAPRSRTSSGVDVKHRELLSWGDKLAGNLFFKTWSYLWKLLIRNLDKLPCIIG